MVRVVSVLLVALGAAAAEPPADKMEPQRPDKACMVVYSGRVQGVGFRATAAGIAKDYPVAGWVKNLPDGRVQLLAEGPAESVDKFLKAIRSHWGSDIEKEEIESRKPTGKFTSFDVVR